VLLDRTYAVITSAFGRAVLFLVSVFRFCARQRKTKNPKMGSTSLPQAQSRNARASAQVVLLDRPGMLDMNGYM
jgi:hypothetical protein